MNKTRMIVSVSILIALEIILTRYFSIQTPIVRIGFGFIPVALASIMFGPVIGGITAALGDIIGMAIAPAGAYFPGFTLSAFLSGVIMGLFLHKSSKTFVHIALAVITVTLFINLGLNTLWLSMITGKAVMVLMIPRMLKEAVMLPIQIFLIHFMWKYIRTFVKLSFLQ